MCSVVSPFSPVLQAHKVHFCWHWSRSHLTCGYAGNWPWWHSGVAFTRPLPQIHWDQVPGLQLSCTWTPCGNYGGSSDSGMTQPPCVCAHKPTAAKARPDPTAGELVFLSDVSQVLNLGSHLQWCNSVRRDFSCEEIFQLFFLSHKVPGAQVWFLPHLCVCSSHQSLL